MVSVIVNPDGSLLWNMMQRVAGRVGKLYLPTVCTFQGGQDETLPTLAVIVIGGDLTPLCSPYQHVFGVEAECNI